MNSQTLVPEKIENFYEGEETPNFEMKCPVVLLVDKSSSMSGEPIAELNKGLKVFQTQIQNNRVAASRLDVALIAFGSDVEIARDFDLLEGTAFPTIRTGGCTKMIEAINEGMNRLESRRAWMKGEGLQGYRGYIILITDGHPNSGGSKPADVDAVKLRLKQAIEVKKLNFLPIGVEGANMEFLNKLAVGGIKAQKLKGFNFIEFFEWLSASLTAVTNSRPGEKVDFTPKPDANPFQMSI